ncbi:MAG: polyamine ABC transporter substrate-binding protein [Bacillota bacterium]|nr:polyamine ABC transporter substrate-binding protein [Bacillota bacterium]
MRALLTVVVLLLAVPLAALAAEKKELVITLPGGSYEVGWKKNVLEPFSKKYGVTFRIVPGLTMETVAKMRAQKGNPEIDVVTLDTVGALQAEAEGLFEPIDPSRIPNMAKMYPIFRNRSKNFVYYKYSTQVIAYNTEKVKKPLSYEDLWKPEYKGHVAIPDINTSHGVTFLMMAARMNGGSEKKIEPGIEKIKTLKPNLYTIWTAHDQLAQLFAREEVWIAYWVSDRVPNLMDAKIPVNWVIPKESAYLVDTVQGIPKGCKNKELAEKYIDFVLSAEVQAANARDIYLGPVNMEAVKLLSSEDQKKLPLGEDLVANLIPVDWQYVNTVRPAWTELWNREIAR